MQTAKNNLKNIRNEQLRSIHKDTNLILSLKQPKTLDGDSTSSRLISSFKNIKKPGTYKYSDKRC